MEVEKKSRRNQRDTRGWATCGELDSNRGNLIGVIEMASNRLSEYLDGPREEAYDNAREIVLDIARRTLCSASISGIAEGLEKLDAVEYMHRKKLAAPPPVLRAK